MRYTRGQFRDDFYSLWQLGLVLPTPHEASVFSVKYRLGPFDEYARVTLKAVSVGDALERACFAITSASPWRPEEVDLHAVYDSEENILWFDEPFYDVIQKKYEFRGMARREFLAKFGLTWTAILFGVRAQPVSAATTSVTLSGTASGISGQQIYTTAGSYTWTVPSAVTSVCVLCVGAGGMGSLAYYTYGTGGGGGGGGGVGLYGVGANGVGGIAPNSHGAGGGGGSGGSGGVYGSTTGCGAGGGTQFAASSSTHTVSPGAVRIIWGSGRSFPSNAT